MKKYFAIILCFFAAISQAQVISTTATLTDSDGQIWAGCTWQADLVNNNNTSYYQGTAITTTHYQGSCDSTGTFTANLNNTSTLTPLSAQWVFRLCSNTSAACSTVTTPVTTSNLSTTLSAGLIAPRFPATGANAHGYNNGEISPTPLAGGSYYNVLDLSIHIWNGTTWSVGSGASSGTSTPQGISCTGGNTIAQSVNGSTQQWVCSPNGAVWTNQTTQAVVYAGANSTVGFTHYYEMNDGTGSATLADSVGATPINVNGGGSGGSPTWNGTNGLTFANVFFQYAGPIPQTFWVQHSTYFFCLNVAGVPSNPGSNLIFGRTDGSYPQLTLSPYGQLKIPTSGLSEASLQSISLNTPTCITYVYNGDGTDQLWIGTTLTQFKNTSTTLVSATGVLGLGGASQPFQGTIYKFGVSVGAALPGDVIQKNALVASAKIAAATSLTVPTAPANYHAGNYTLWAIGDSRSDVGGNSCAAFLGCVYNNYFGNYYGSTAIPGLTVLNGGTGGQTLLNYVSEGIFNQATSVLSEITIPGAPPPPHFSVFRMGTNDIAAGTSGAAIYSAYQSAILPLTQNGWTVISMTEPSYSSAHDANRLAYNALLMTSGQQAGLVDLADDLRFTNPAYLTTFGNFTPYQLDGLHDTTFGASAINGRVQTVMNQLGFLGHGQNFTPAYSQYLDIDLAQGPVQTVTLTGNVSVLKLINGNQGSKLDLTICQDGTGGRTVTAPAVGSGATATVTSAGVITLTGGGSNYDQNFMPVLYTSGLTCSTYPRYSSTITNGVITGISQIVAGSGCSGSGTVVFIPTEPKWNNFNTSGVNALAAGACLKQSFTYDGVGQTIN